ncbi:MAG: hypothetical protein ABGF52_06395 [Candidatus Asgardarchaeum sp.]
MSQQNVIKSKSDLINLARRILRNVECVKREESDAVSSSFVRKVLEISQKVDSIEEFKLYVGYFVSKNAKSPDSGLYTFQHNLENALKQIKYDLNTLRTLIEYVVMLHTIKAKEEEYSGWW